MSFFNLSDNEDATQTGATFEIGGGVIAPISNNTNLLAVIDEAKWDFTPQNEQFISLRWAVLSPQEFANRKVFHKVKVLSANPKQADKAKRMLAAIDANAGGKLAAAGSQPTDQSLQVLLNKPMVIKVQVWEMENGEGVNKKGNWVCAVSPKSATPAAAPRPTARAMAPAPSAPYQHGPSSADLSDFDDDIPF